MTIIFTISVSDTKKQRPRIFNRKTICGYNRYFPIPVL